MKGNEMFERGLPGYDSWLDNHGNPGIWDEEDLHPYKWVITERVYVTQLTANPDTYKINRKDGIGEIILSFGSSPDYSDNVDERTMLINGDYMDLDDDFVSFMSLLDDFHEQGDGILNRAILMVPFDDELSGHGSHGGWEAE